ncbi:MAG: hypothetical protein GF364_05570 [Candidatus Lokiarchaeota archaeon]|nr:hypothetical protein [Candidatus Lokiarchaeota archaeon]
MKKVIHDSEDITINDEEIKNIFNCTKCEACQTVCSQGLPLIEMFDWTRSKINEKYGFRNKKQEYLVKNIIETGNPFAEKSSRLASVPDEIKRAKIFDKKTNNGKVLVHLGCMLAYRLKDMRNDVLKILELLDIDYVLLEDEECCGYFIWNTGDHKSAEKVIRKNEKKFKPFSKIICACAGCFTFFKSNYKENIKFEHFIETIYHRFIEIEERNEIKIQKEAKLQKPVIFHDSCHLTRPHGIIDEPRIIMNKMGLKLTEFSMSKDKGLCCGADGGMRIVNPKLSLEITKDRTKEAATKSKKLYTLCPFCIYNFYEAKQQGLEIGSLYQTIRVFLEKNRLL